VTDHNKVEPLELGMHALALITSEARRKRLAVMPANLDMFGKIAGTARLHDMLTAEAGGETIIAAWQKDVASFKQRRSAYLLYPN
jgi:uncharacterized protein YbbC (DUF1343 family)